MKKNSYYKHRIVFILLAFSLSIQKSLCNQILLNKQSKYCFKIDKKIEKLKKEISVLLEKITNEESLILILNKQAELKEEIKESSLYKNIEYIKSCINLLDDLKKYNNALMQPKLLQKIDLLLPSIKKQKAEDLISVLLEERIYLLEASDEFFTIRSVLNKIELLLQQQQDQLNQHYLVLRQSSTYENLLAISKLYTNHELIMLLNKKIIELWHAYLEKESKLLQKKNYRYFLYEELSTQKEFDIFSFTKELQELYELKNKFSIDTLLEIS